MNTTAGAALGWIAAALFLALWRVPSAVDAQPMRRERVYLTKTR
jgi:hypothetical protein